MAAPMQALHLRRIPAEPLQTRMLPRARVLMAERVPRSVRNLPRQQGGPHAARPGVTSPVYGRRAPWTVGRQAVRVSLRTPIVARPRRAMADAAPL